MLSFTSIVSICIGTVILLSFGIHTVICLVKAKKSGIVRTAYTAQRKKTIFDLGIAAVYLVFSVIHGVTAYSFNVYIRDMDTRGRDAIAEHRGVSVDELSVSEEVRPAYLDKISASIDYQILCENAKEWFISHERHIYSQSAAYHIEMMIVCLFISIVSAASVLTHRAFFTGDGIYVLDKSDTSPLKAYAQVNGKYLCFYEKSVPNRHLISVKATDENLEAYKKFIMPEGFRVCC